MKAKPPFLCLKPGFDLALGKVLLTGVGTAPSSTSIMLSLYKKFSVGYRSKFSEHHVKGFRTKFMLDWVNNFRTGKSGFWN